MLADLKRRPLTLALYYAPPVRRGVFSKQDFSNQLHLASGHTDPVDLSDMTRADQVIRQGERWMIDDIGGVGAEVQFRSLRKSKRLVE